MKSNWLIFTEKTSGKLVAVPVSTISFVADSGEGFAFIGTKGEPDEVAYRAEGTSVEELFDLTRGLDRTEGPALVWRGDL